MARIVKAKEFFPPFDIKRIFEYLGQKKGV
jgi:hypothetical protein